jgi:hypothetical protein
LPPPAISSQPTSNGFQLSCLTIPGITYEVQASTNLTNWTIIFTNRADTNGFLLFNDPSSSTNPIRFFRLFVPLRDGEAAPSHWCSFPSMCENPAL